MQMYIETLQVFTGVLVSMSSEVLILTLLFVMWGISMFATIVLAYLGTGVDHKLNIDEIHIRTVLSLVIGTIVVAFFSTTFYIMIDAIVEGTYYVK